MMLRNIGRRLAVAAIAVAAASCLFGGKPQTPQLPQPPPQVALPPEVGALLKERAADPIPINLTLQASAEINPSESNRPSPVVVRVYQLKNSEKFMNAAYEKLLDEETATLGDDLVKVTAHTLRPGQEQTVSIPFNRDVRVVGIAAFFRDYDKKQWRIPIPAPIKADGIIRVELTSVSFAVK